MLIGPVSARSTRGGFALGLTADPDGQAGLSLPAPQRWKVPRPGQKGAQTSGVQPLGKRIFEEEKADSSGRHGLQTAKGGQFAQYIRAAHEGFADEEGVCPGLREAFGIFDGLDPAFADEDDVVRYFLGQKLGGGQIDREGFEVAIVDADDPGVRGQGPFEFREIVDLDEGVELKGVSDLEKVFQCRLIKRGNDEQDRVGTRDDGFEDLCLMNDEVFAEAGNAHFVANEREVFKTPLKVLFVGEDGDRGRSGLVISPRDGEGVEVFTDGAR